MPLSRQLLATPTLEVGLVLPWSSGFIGAEFASATSSIFLVLFWRFVLAALILVPLARPGLPEWGGARSRCRP